MKGKVVEQVTFKIIHDPNNSDNIRINGKGKSAACVSLRRAAGWTIPNKDYIATWKLSKRGRWEIILDTCSNNIVVRLYRNDAYEVCGLPKNWAGKKATRTTEAIKEVKGRKHGR